MADHINVLNRAVSLDTYPAFAPYTGVRLWYDDEHAFFAGDETGRVLEADCPWATQAIADSILASVSGFVYRPFTAQTTLLDPAAELGDAVNVGGVYSVLADINTTFDAMYASDIGAPAEEEIDHEYPYLTKQQREMNRKVTLGADYYGTRITRKNGIEVVTTGADGTEKARVVLNSDVLAFYNDDGAEALYFDAQAGKYRFQGDVNITGGKLNINNNFVVTEDGDVYINGNINFSKMTGDIEWGEKNPAAGIEPGLSEDEVNDLIGQGLADLELGLSEDEVTALIGQTMDGLALSVSNGKTSSSISLTLGGVEISSGEILLDGDVVFASDLTDGETEISGNNIRTGTVKADHIKLGGSMNLYEGTDDTSDRAGRFGFITVTNGDGDAETAVGIVSAWPSNESGKPMVDADGYSTHSVYLASVKKAYIAGEEGFYMNTNANAFYKCPSRSGHLFYGNLIALNEVAVHVTSSDRRLKTDIDYNQTDKMIELFDRLNPVTFHQTEWKPELLHAGFIAQDVVEAAEQVGLSGVLTDVDSNGYYGLNYGEITALLTAKVQQLDAELRALKNA